MDHDHARALLAAERTRVATLLEESAAAGDGDRLAEAEPGEMYDSAQPLEAEGVDDAIAASLRERLAAIERAEQRLADGGYGLSVQSGAAIPDERLENDPAAELTVTEAAAAAR